MLKLLSDKNRYNILKKLLDFDQLCVCEIEQLLGLKQANTSKHLKRFKDLKVVETSREGNVVYYRLSESFVLEHEDLIKYIIM